MSDFYEGLREIEKQLNFADKSYDEQLRLRRKVAFKYAWENDEKFKDFSDDAKRRIVQRAVDGLPPRYKDKVFGKMATDLSEAVKAGDGRAMGVLLQQKYMDAARNNGMFGLASSLIGMKLSDWITQKQQEGGGEVPRTLKKLLQSAFLGIPGLQMMAPGAAMDILGKELATHISQMDPDEQSQPYSKMLKDLTIGLTNGDPNTNFAKYGTKEFVTHPEIDKLHDYVSTTVLTGNPETKEKFTKAIERMEPMGQTGAFVADLAAFFGLVALPVEGAMQKVATRLTPWALGTKASGVAKWFARAGMPMIADAASSGMFGVLREQVLALGNEDEERFIDTNREFLRTFGAWAWGDVVIGGAFRTLGHFWKGSIKSILQGGGKKIRRAKLARSSDEAWDQVRKLLRTSPVEEADELLGPIRQADSAWMSSIKATYPGKEALANPTVRLVYEADTLGLTVKHAPNGTVRIHWPKVKDPSEPIQWVSKHYDDIKAAERALGDYVVDNYTKNMSFGERKAWLKESEFRQSPHNMGVIRRNIDEVLDPARKLDIDARAAKEIQNARPKGYISEAQRASITPAEADAHASAFAVRLGSKDEVAELLKTNQGNRLYQPGTTKTFDLAASQEGVPGIVIVNTPATADEVAEAYKYARQAKQLGAHGEIDDIARVRLMQLGRDSIINTDQAGNPISIETFVPEHVKVVSAAQEVALADRQVAKAANAHGIVSGKIRARIAAADIDEDMLANLVVPNTYGKVDEKQLQKFIKLYGEARGGLTKDVTVATARRGKLASFEDVGNQLRVSVAEEIKTPEQQYRFIDNLFGVLDEIDATYTKGGGKPLTNIAKKVRDTVEEMQKKFQMPLRDPESQRKFLQRMLDKSLRTRGSNLTKYGGKYNLDIGGVRKTFDSFEDVVDYTVTRSYNPEALRAEMLRQGYYIKGGEKGGPIFVHGKDLKQGIRANDIYDAANKLNFRPDRLPNKYAPYELAINEDSVTLTYDGDLATGTKKQLLAFIDRFENKNKFTYMNKIISSTDGDIYKTTAGGFKVEMPGVGIYRDVETLEEARKLLNTEWDDFASILEHAQAKSMRVLETPEGFKFYPPGKSGPITAKNADEVKRVMAQWPDPDGAQELFEAYSPGFTDEFEDLIYRNTAFDLPTPTDRIPFDATTQLGGDFGKSATYGVRDKINHAVAQTNKTFEAWHMRHKGDPLVEGVMTAKRHFDEAVRQYNMSFHEASEIFLRDVMVTPKGKELYLRRNLDRARALFYHIIKDRDPGAMKVYKTLTENNPLTPDELAVAPRIRDFFDDLGKRFGIQQKDWIMDYLPRIQDRMRMVEEMGSTLDPSKVTTKEFTKRFGIPDGIDFFADHARTQEFLSFVIQDNPTIVGMEYAKKGFQKLYLDEAIKEFKSAVSKVQTGDAGLYAHAQEYIEAVTNTGFTSGEKFMMDLGNSISEALRKKAAQKDLAKVYKIGTKSNLLSNIYSLNYLTNMGWRPWLAVRNVHQIYTTLAPRFGLSAVNRAVNWLDSAPAKQSQDFVEMLRKRAIIQRRPPVLGDISDSASFLQRTTSKGLRWFTGSDEYTRAVAYLTAKFELDDAIQAVGRGKINLFTDEGVEQFRKASSLRKINPNTADEIIDHVKQSFSKGGITDMTAKSHRAAAETLFGKTIIDETMFVYHPAQNPKVFRGVIGKMLGQYGTYSVGYRANVWRGLKYGTFGDKAAFVTRFLGYQGALWAGFSALGIKATNFLPFMPAMFSGGPLMDMAYNLVKLSDLNAYKRDQSRSELGRALKGLVPGSMQYRYLKKAIEYAEDGDPWKAFLSLMTVPTRDYLFEE